MISDMAMPHMDGRQLAEAVRRLHPQLPIILASGYAQRQDGPVPELPRIFKPFSQAQLRDALAQVLAQSAAG